MTHYDFYGVMKNAPSSDVMKLDSGRERLVTLVPGDTLSHPGSSKPNHYIKGPAKVLCLIQPHGSSEVVINPNAEAWLFVFGHLMTERTELERLFAKLPEDPEDDDAEQVTERQVIVDGFRRIARSFDEGVTFINKSLSSGGKLPPRWER